MSDAEAIERLAEAARLVRVAPEREEVPDAD